MKDGAARPIFSPGNIAMALYDQGIHNLTDGIKY